MGRSKEDLLDLPDDVVDDFGYLLGEIQLGRDIPCAAMSSIGSGAMEIWVDTGDTFRIFYVAKFPEALYVLHCFQKKSKKGIATPKRDLEMGESRYKEMQKFRSLL